MLPSTTVKISGLGLYSYIFCNKSFKVFLAGQTFKDKSTPLLAIKSLLFSHKLFILYSVK